MKRTASISEILRPLKDAPFQAYLSSALQVADILEWILDQTGTAEVWQTSFSISEEFLRRLFFLKKKRPISRFNLVLDHKADNHSKILLVRSDRGDTVAVVTSQNLTRGNRAESAFISTSPEIFANLHASVLDIIENHSVPLNDLFNQRLTAANELR